jgi:hypothetical protein
MSPGSDYRSPLALIRKPHVGLRNATLIRPGSLGSRRTAEPGSSSRATLRRPVRKLYEVDPFVCSRFGGRMKIVAFLTQGSVVDRIIDHLNCRLQPSGLRRIGLSRISPWLLIPRSIIFRDWTIPERRGLDDFKLMRRLEPPPGRPGLSGVFVTASDRSFILVSEGKMGFQDVTGFATAAGRKRKFLSLTSSRGSADGGAGIRAGRGTPS